MGSRDPQYQPTVKTRDRLRDSEAESQLDRSFRNTPIGLCYFDKELRYLRVNKWLARINGLPVEKHLGRKLADVLPDVAIGAEQQLRHVLQTGEPIVNGLVNTTNRVADVSATHLERFRKGRFRTCPETLGRALTRHYP